MTENTEIERSALPEAEQQTEKAEGTDTNPTPSDEESFIPIKFNKEIKNISFKEAGILAQKGLKFEAIEKDYTALKELAAKESKSVPELIAGLTRQYNETKKASLTEKCGGDTELAEHIISLENGISHDNGFAELKEAFPKIATPQQLPESVLRNCELKGTLLLDEYLRYLLAEEMSAKAQAEQQKNVQKASTGSLANQFGGSSPEAEEFIKGLWK